MSIVRLSIIIPSVDFPNDTIPIRRSPESSFFQMIETKWTTLPKGVSRSQTKGSWYDPFRQSTLMELKIREIDGSGLVFSG